MKELYGYWLLHLFAILFNILAIILNYVKYLESHLIISLIAIITSFICVAYLLYILILEIKSFRFTLGSLLTLVGKKCRIAWLYKLGDKVK